MKRLQRNGDGDDGRELNGETLQITETKIATRFLDHECTSASTRRV